MLFKRWLICITLLLLLIGSASAQDADQPLIIVKQGDLWEWTGGETLRQKTQWGFNSSIQISPNTDEVAYSSVATLVVDYLREENEGFGGAPLPNNLWIMTTAASDEATRIADQPADASFAIPGVPDTTITRSVPIWSPDGQEIAWTEPLSASGLFYQVVIYNKVSGITRILPIEIVTEAKTILGIWTYNGLILRTAIFNNSTISFEETYIVLDAQTGAQKAMIKPMLIPTVNGRQRPMSTIPVQYEESIWLATLYMGSESSQWVLYDLVTGEQRDAPTPPRATRVLEGAETGLYVVPHILNNQVLSYNVFAPTGNPIPMTNNPQKYVSKFALSPDGRAIAYQLGTLGSSDFDSTIYVWRSGVIGVVPQTGSDDGAQEFVWANPTWIIE